MLTATLANVLPYCHVLRNWKENAVKSILLLEIVSGLRSRKESILECMGVRGQKVFRSNKEGRSEQD